MKHCPGCNATLPDAAVRCQFCGQALSAPPPVRVPSARPQGASGVMPGAPAWVGVAYNLIAVYWLISGLWSALAASVLSGSGEPNILSVVFGSATSLVGLGLLLRIEFVRGIVNFLCGLQILFGLLGVVTSFLGGQPLGLVLSLVQIATAGFMMFLIGETETRPPNL